MNVRGLALLLPLSLSLGCEPELAAGSASAPQTSRLGISRDGATLYVALADHDLVRAVDAKTGEPRGEVRVDGTPHRLTVLGDGRVAVTARQAGTLSIVDVEAGRIEASLEVGSEPHGVIEVDGSLLVAVSGERHLARVALSDPTRVAARIPLDHDDPRGLARTEDGKVIVSHFSAGVLSVVRGDRASGRVPMRLPSKTFFFPNQMDSVTVSTDGLEVGVPHVECNNDPAQFGASGTTLVGAAPPVVAYYFEGPTGYPAVVPAVSSVDAIDEVMISDEDRAFEEAVGYVPERGGAPAAVINPLNRALLGEEKINGPTALAYVRSGALRLVVARGSGNVFVQRSRIREGERSIVGVIPVGVGAEAIQVSPDGATAYVYNAFDDTVTSFRVPRAPEEGSRFAVETARALQRIEPLASFPVAAPILPAEVLRGRVLFHAVDDRLTQMGAISCASCHPGGAEDGTTWSFAEGPRQSPALWGGIVGTEPFHWDQAVRDMADISRVTIQGRMGGSGLGRGDMDAIGAFLDSIPVPAPPRNLDPASVARGEAIFFSEATACASCHAGASFTDNRAHDVGTGRGFTERESAVTFATPVLHGLAHTGPYLHDGSARTLRDVIDRLVTTDRMGKGSHLDEQDKQDLVAFLMSL
jgi:DNA-binding beta-propeller fold protein YncE/mono/diheme cytochrome c family protein